MSTAILAPGSRGRRLSKRLLQVVITLFGLLLLTFTIGRVMPIDPVLAIVGRTLIRVPISRFTSSWGLINR